MREIEAHITELENANQHFLLNFIPFTDDFEPFRENNTFANVIFVNFIAIGNVFKYI